MMIAMEIANTTQESLRVAKNGLKAQVRPRRATTNAIREKGLLKASCRKFTFCGFRSKKAI
jgi:hypothetical protein